MAKYKKKPNGKNDTGRPTKYKPEYCQLLIEHMAKGFSFECFGAVCDIDDKTLYRWTSEGDEQFIPEFFEAKKMAFVKNRYFWEDTGIEGRWNEPGKKTLNTGVWRTNMKNRFGWTENPAVIVQQVVDSSHKDINLDTASDEELIEGIEDKANGID